MTLFTRLSEFIQDPQTARVALYISTGSIILTFILLMVYLTQPSKNDNLIKGAMGMISIGLIPVASLLIAGVGVGAAATADKSRDLAIRGKNAAVAYTKRRIAVLNASIRSLNERANAMGKSIEESINRRKRQMVLSTEDIAKLAEYDALKRQQSDEEARLAKLEAEELEDGRDANLDTNSRPADTPEFSTLTTQAYW